MPQFLNEQKADCRIFHSLQTFGSNSTGTPSTNNLSITPIQIQQRQRSMGSILSAITATDDVMSVDQSMLAHDGSRDRSVVPE